VNVLGFDTSSAATAAAVLRADGAVFEHSSPGEDSGARPGHARELMPAVARVMEEASITFAELSLIALSRGPGSFTGLRIAAATARGLAHAHGTPVRGVSSLAALAAGAGEGLVLALLDARRGELFAALYEGGAELWSPFAAAPEAVAARAGELSRPPLAVGDGSLRSRVMLEAAGVRVAPADSPAHAVRAASVCRLGAVATDSPEATLPLYIREPDARPAR
jgi:tRNA threonylcarbamoyladenosine biosynthesis protein TsaB